MRMLQKFFVAILCAFAVSAFANAAENPRKQAQQKIAEIKLHAISVFGDIKYPANFQHFDYVNPNAPKGGKITMPEIGTFNNLNQHLLKGTIAAGVGLLFDSLMQPALDETGTQYPLVAQAVRIAEDKSYIVFELNRKARFADGSKITADDVAFTFNKLLSDGHPIYKILFADVSGVKRSNKYEVRFDIKNPNNREIFTLLGQLPVLSKAYYAQHDFTKTTLEPPLGSGPYRVKTVEAGRGISYELRDDYWAKDLPVNRGVYNFGEVAYEYYKDANVAIQAFKAGKLDLRYENIAKNWATAYDIDAVRDGRIKKEKIHHKIPTGMQAFAFNLRKGKFADVHVRKALNLALDFEWMNKNLFYGSYDRTSSYFSNSIYAAQGLPSADELALLEPLRGQVPAEVFLTEFKQPVSDGSGRIRTRLLEAKSLLAEAGWNVVDGKLQKNGEVFEIEFLLPNGSALDRLLPSFFENLKRLGIVANEREVDPSQYKQRVEGFDFDIIVNVWGQGNSPGNEQLDYWHSRSADVAGSSNVSGIKNPAVDALVEKIVQAKTKPALVAATAALDRVLLWNYYTIPQHHAGYFRILYWDKFAMPTTRPLFDGNFGLWTWWMK